MENDIHKYVLILIFFPLSLNGQVGLMSKLIEWYSSSPWCVLIIIRYLTQECRINEMFDSSYYNRLKEYIYVPLNYRLFSRSLFI